MKECLAFITERLSFREEIVCLNANLPEQLRTQTYTCTLENHRWRSANMDALPVSGTITPEQLIDLRHEWEEDMDFLHDLGQGSGRTVPSSRDGHA